MVDGAEHRHPELDSGSIENMWEWILDRVHNDGFLVFSFRLIVTYRHPELDSGSIEKENGLRIKSTMTG